jgi:cysteine protease ATG4
VQSFPEAGLGVAVAYDGVVFQSDVYAASDASALSKRSQHQHGSSSSSSAGAPAASWGGRAVLVLIGIRLGLDGVNPVYYDSIKVSLPPPQCI